MKALLLPLAAAAALLASCAPSNPQARIEQAPHLFENLSAEHRRAVTEGRIERGMSPDDVYLAWGRPASEYVGEESGQRTLRWDYAGSRPVYTTDTFATFGYGRYPYGRLGRYGYYGYPTYGTGTSVTYVPYRKATVWFRNDRVTKWERRR